MDFLHNLSTMQRGAGAAILVLLLALLLVKQRQAKAAPAGAKGEKAAKAKSPKGGKSRGGLARGRKRKDAEAPAFEPTSEPKAGRMVPRLPAAQDDPVGGVPTSEFDALAEATLAEPLTASDAGAGMINEPGWPTAGEVWTPDGAGAHDVQPVAPAAQAPSAVDESDEPVVPDWDAEAEVFDPATGWGAQLEADEEAEEPEPADAVALTDDAWSKPDDGFDWTAEDPAEAWAAAPEVVEVVSDADASWQAPEDEPSVWTNSSDPAWETAGASVEVVPTAVTAVADPAFSVSDWGHGDAGHHEPDAGEDDPSTLVWEPVDAAEAAEEVEVDREPVAVARPFVPVPVAEVAEPVFEAVAEEEPVAVDVPFVSEPVAEVAAPVFHEAVEHEPIVHVEPRFVPEPVAEVAEPVLHGVVEEEPVADVEAPFVPEPVVEVAEPVVAAATVVSEPAPDVNLVTVPSIEVPEPLVLRPVDDDEFEVPDSVEAPAFAVAVAPVEVAYVPPVPPASAPAVNPVSKWASMSPGGVESRSAGDPVSSWARLQPGRVEPSNGHAPQHVPAVSHAPAASPVAVALAPSASPSVAWWDMPSGMESDPRRGRFALGGYALAPGHQVVSGVTFRDGVVPPPEHWVIGPVVGAVAPGTLVLEVDGCLNCRPEDLAVLMDPGFAPTPDGFSLKLIAAAQGPFAASGTYVIS